MLAIKGVCSLSRTRTTKNLKLTAILSICCVEETFNIERGGKSILDRLCKKVLFERERWVFDQFAPLLDCLPPNKSSFSRPVGFLSDISSPVPIAPCLPLRNTSARAV